MIQREELSHVFEMVCPWEALDDESLRAASEFAAAEVQAMFPDIKAHAERRVATTSAGWIVREGMAEEAMRRGRSIRNQWLRDHRAFGDRRGYRVSHA